MEVSKILKSTKCGHSELKGGQLYSAIGIWYVAYKVTAEIACCYASQLPLMVI